MTLSYASIEPITAAIRAARQTAKRHYGVHPYFTRRPPNVVRTYIEKFTKPGDRVLDPFGGSGVTAIEALLTNRQGIQSDINPLANFIASEIADRSYPDTEYIRRAYAQVERDSGDLVRSIPRMMDKDIDKELGRHALPENVRLPENSDESNFFDLFTSRQLLALAVIKHAIDKVQDIPAKRQLLLAWSATLGKLNKTFLSAKGRAESRGGSSIFSIYRYKVAKNPVELPPWRIFSERVGNVIAAKEEVLREVLYLKSMGKFIGKFECHNEDVSDLCREIEPVDYVFTDPPYGGHIAYLDLSTIWNHWLGFPVPDRIREKEIIVGGDLKKTEESYLRELRQSIRSTCGILKKNRWVSIVFQHWNVAYFEAILQSAEDAGAEFRSAVTQAGDTIWSMHKKKNQERVLAGEMILTFFKGGKNGKTASKDEPLAVSELIDRVLAELASPGKPIHGEVLFNRLIVEAWKSRSLGTLRISREDFIDALHQKGWGYDAKQHCWVPKIGGVQHEPKLWRTA